VGGDFIQVTAEMPRLVAPGRRIEYDARLQAFSRGETKPAKKEEGRRMNAE
jgi:hypothetical protein